MRPVVFDLTVYMNGVAYDHVDSMKVGKFAIGRAPDGLKVEDITGDIGVDMAPSLARGLLEVDLTVEEVKEVHRLEDLGMSKTEAIRKVLPVEEAFGRALGDDGKLTLDFTG